MNFIDVILGILLLWGLIKGLSRGLFTSLASLVALLIGVYAAVHFSSIVGGWLGNKVDWNENTVSLTAFAITFLMVVLGIQLAGKILTKIADFAALGIVNKLLGGLFGLLKMAFIASAAFMLINGINDKIEFIKKETLDASILYAPVSAIAPIILPELLKKKDTEAPEDTENGSES